MEFHCTFPSCTNVTQIRQLQFDLRFENDLSMGHRQVWRTSLEFGIYLAEVNRLILSLSLNETMRITMEKFRARSDQYKLHTGRSKSFYVFLPHSNFYKLCTSLFLSCHRTSLGPVMSLTEFVLKMSSVHNTHAATRAHTGDR